MPNKRPMKDIVILLPGILGSVLQVDGKDAWAFSKGAFLRGLLSRADSIRDLKLENDDPDVADLGDGVTAPRVMDDVHLIPGFWKIDGYSTIRSHLQRSFQLEADENWFEFPYDWRRDNRVAARKLAVSINQWLPEWRSHSGSTDAKVIFVAHSMGGLVARYYLEELGGWENTRSLVTFGTPYRGSLNALGFLANGFRKGFGPVSLDLTELVRSLTSVYQLLPTYRCVDTGGGNLERLHEMARLPNGVDAAKVVAAADFHNGITAAVDRNGGPGRYDIHPVVGVYQPTNQSAEFINNTVRMLKTYEEEDMGGDGTVPRVSATPLELSDDPREMYATQKHSSLQNADSVLDHIVGVLSRRPLGAFRDTPFDGLSLSMEDLFAEDEGVTFEIETGGPVSGIRGAIENLDSGYQTEIDRIDLVDGAAAGDVGVLDAGVYRITLQDDDGVGVRPVSDVFVVAGDETVLES